MSAKNTNPEYLDEMREDVVACFKGIVRTWDGPYPIPVAALYNRVINSQQRRYYVSPLRAYKVLSRMRKGDMSEVNRMPPLRREMYRQLFEIASRLERKTTYRGMPYFHICSFAVAQPAPRLFVGYHTVQNIINQHYKMKVSCRK